jgi:hypothetical protein
MDELFAYVREDAIALESKFRKSSISGAGTAQEVADFREHALQDFVRRFFPFPHQITKGKIRDSYGAISDSVDCVVCNPNHPHTIDSNGKFQLLFAEGIDAAIEVKPDIAAHAELVRGLEQGLSVKALKRASEPTLTRMPWFVERSKRVPFVVFAMRCKADPLDTGKEIVQFYKERGTPPVQQADFVAVNNVGIFANFIDASMCPWNELKGERTGWFFEKWGLDSLGGFLQHLQGVAHAAIKMQDDVLPRYLKHRGLPLVCRIEP